MSVVGRFDAHLSCYSPGVVDDTPVTPELDHCAHRSRLWGCRHNRHGFTEGAESRQRLASEAEGGDLRELLE